MNNHKDHCSKCKTPCDSTDNYCRYCGEKLYLTFEQLPETEQATIVKEAESFIDSYLQFDVKEEDSSLTEAELHCMARLLQSSIYIDKDYIFPAHLYGCMYCKYGVECKDKGGNYRNNLRRKLEALTGIYLSHQIHRPIEKNYFPQSYQELYLEKCRRTLKEIYERR